MAVAPSVMARRHGRSTPDAAQFGILGISPTGEASRNRRFSVRMVSRDAYIPSERPPPQGSTTIESTLRVL